jgi:hypothetical protein
MGRDDTRSMPPTPYEVTARTHAIALGLSLPARRSAKEERQGARMDGLVLRAGG